MKTPSRTINVYKSYTFKDKDPAIDAIRTAIEKAKVPWSKVSADSGVSEGTIYNWLQGKTRRPQFATLNAVARALGLEFRLVWRK